ncbi:MAG: STAS domain-containing protein [Timaviella obliquedivisa GSE-PSE-MK23-08B]|jgi:anti-anti-sigma factor|nr:STAS domain-containing protein [Timaviella obliquedivisa GSE-PSE-MK23-08B]
MSNVLTHSKTKIVKLQGNINAENAAEIGEYLADIISAQENSSLMVDMSQVVALDSAGLMILVSTLTLAQHLNKQFGLFGVSASVRIIFELTQLDRVFEISSESQPFPDLDLVAA